MANPRMHFSTSLLVTQTPEAAAPSSAQRPVRGPSEAQRVALAAVAAGGRMTLQASAGMYADIKRLRSSS